MAEFLERDRDETKDWRKFAIPALGSIVLVLVGVIVSLVTLDRGGIKAEICDLRAEMKERAAENKRLIDGVLAKVEMVIAKDRADSERLRDLELLIRLSFPERARLFSGESKAPINGNLKNRLESGGNHGKP